MVRLLNFPVLVTGFLTTSYILTTNLRSWNATVSSQLRTSIDASSADDTPPAVRGPRGAAVEITGPTLRDVCRSLLSGETSMLEWPAPTPVSASEYIRRANDCDRFRSELGYLEEASDEERGFPIAFSLLTYENLEQTERLLRLIYRPQNVYCVHVDAKSSGELRAALQAIAACFDNVFVARPPIRVDWGTISVVRAELRCMRQLLVADGRWRYFVNLVGRDFPLRTNRELVEILRAYDGANDVEGTRRER